MKVLEGATLWARQTTESDVFKKPHAWFKIWFYIVSKVNHKDNKQFKRSEGFFKYSWIMDTCEVSRSECDHAIRWFKSCQMLATRKATRGFYATVLNYNLYQDTNTYKSDTESEIKATQKRHRSDTINNNDNNDNNILTKVNKVKDRNEEVDYILEQFKNRYGFSPIDKKPRQVAYNISQITKTFIKNYGAIYEVKKGEKAETKTIISRVFDKFFEEKYAQETQYLDTFKRHLKKILEITGNRLTQVNNLPQTN